MKALCTLHSRSYCLESLHNRMWGMAFSVMWTLLRFLATKCLLIFCSALKSIPVLSAKEQYSSAVCSLKPLMWGLYFWIWLSSCLFRRLRIVLSLVRTQAPYLVKGGRLLESCYLASCTGDESQAGWAEAHVELWLPVCMVWATVGTEVLLIPSSIEIHAVRSKQGEGCYAVTEPPWLALVLQFTIRAFIYRHSCIAHRCPVFPLSWQPFGRTLQ